MHRFAIALAIVIPFAATQSCAAEFDPRPIDDVMQKALQAFHTPGAAIVVVKDGKVVLLKGYGVRKLGNATP